MRTVRLRDIKPLLQGHQVGAELDSNAGNRPEAAAWAPALCCFLVWRLRLGGTTSSARKYIQMFVARWKCEQCSEIFFVPEKLGIQDFIWGGIHFKHLLQNLSTARDRFLGQLQTLSCHVWPLTFWVCSHSWLGPGIEFHADKIVQKTEPLHSNTEYLCHVIFCFHLPRGQPALVCNPSKSQASP